MEKNDKADRVAAGLMRADSDSKGWHECLGWEAHYGHEADMGWVHFEDKGWNGVG